MQARRSTAHVLFRALLPAALLASSSGCPIVAGGAALGTVDGVILANRPMYMVVGGLVGAGLATLAILVHCALEPCWT